MAELIATFGFEPVIIILLIAIPSIISMISWCKKLWGQRENFKQANIAQGRSLEKREEQEEERFSSGEARIQDLELQMKTLTDIIIKQQTQIDLLIQSDELDIKSWIKTQHEKWMPKKHIDSQILDLLEQRYAVYTKEGGNSWAEKLMKELRTLPTYSVESLSDKDKAQK